MFWYVQKDVYLVIACDNYNVIVHVCLRAAYGISTDEFVVLDVLLIRFERWSASLISIIGRKRNRCNIRLVLRNEWTWSVRWLCILLAITYRAWFIDICVS